MQRQASGIAPEYQRTSPPLLKRFHGRSCGRTPHLLESLVGLNLVGDDLTGVGIFENHLAPPQQLSQIVFVHLAARGDAARLEAPVPLLDGAGLLKVRRRAVPEGITGGLLAQSLDQLRGERRRRMRGRCRP